MYVTSTHIENLRCFADASLKLQHPDLKERGQPALELPNINLLLGNNGAGKTTVLRAIALGALAPVMARSSGYKPYRMVRRRDREDHDQRSGNVEVKLLLHKQDANGSSSVVKTAKLAIQIVSLGDEEWIESTKEIVQPRWQQMFNNASPAFLVLGYGTMRRVSEARNFDTEKELKRHSLRYLRVAGLFENDVPLTPLHSWLPAMQSTNRGRYTQVVHLLDRLLPVEASFTGEFDGTEYFFDLRGAKVPFAALSDGYRGYIGWIADMLYHICKGAPSGAKLVDNRGIVLVDEIDLLLHPEWQRTVLQTISEALPNMQFIFSTHSPIIAGSVRKENIFVMDIDEYGAATIEQYDEHIYGLNAEQVLTSSYFGLRTTRAASFVENELQPLTQKALRGDREAATTFVRKLAGERDPKHASRSPSAVSLPRVDDEEFQAMLQTYQNEARLHGSARKAAKKSASRKGRSKANAKR
ncbi:MAG: AAA family ATPase [Blastocatellia bacterium]